MRTPLSVLAFTSALALAATAHAVVLYDNLDGNPGGSDSVSDFGPLADSFSTGSFSGDLSSVSVLVGGSSTSSGTITVSLLSDDATSPGAVLTTLGTISPGDLTADGSVFTFSNATPLTASNRYWIELTSSNTSASWFWADSDNGTGVAGEFFSNANGVFPAADGPYEMQVIGADAVGTVPEPAAWSLMILGVGLTGAAMRRRREAVAA
ncbi:MAG TPA: choice-of-anchor R domain-containing protein [Caulobacteraceae bacterium]|jgi:hypothetical protein|nr:choice-of-anchor R domain-containing protein [Caulobacteraceae bacterium]